MLNLEAGGEPPAAARSPTRSRLPSALLPRALVAVGRGDDALIMAVQATGLGSAVACLLSAGVRQRPRRAHLARSGTGCMAAQSARHWGATSGPTFTSPHGIVLSLTFIGQTA